MNEETNSNESISNESFKSESDSSNSDSINRSNSLRGLHGYLDSLETRLEADITTSLKYRATDVYHNFNDLNPNGNSSGKDVFSKILGVPSNNETFNNIAAEPNYVKRFLSNSLDSESSTNILRRRLPTAGIDPNNPAVVQELMQGMFSNNRVTANHGFSLGGFKSRLTAPAQTSPSPAIAGQLAQAMRDSLTHRSTKEILDGISGFQSRPDVGFYGFLFTGAGLPTSGAEITSEVRAIFFQFQNSDLMNVMMREGVSFDLLTQRLDEQAFAQSDAQRVSILAGNELILNSTETFTDDTVIGRKAAAGINYHHAFHPKAGYVTLNLDPNTGNDNTKYRVGFIGTQNITAATSRHSTIESMLMVREQKDKTSVEGRLFEEIKTYTDTLLNTRFINQVNKDNADLNRLSGAAYNEKGKAIYKGITNTLSQTLDNGHTNNRFLKVNSEIIDSYTNLLQKLKQPGNENLVAVLSFSEINQLGDSEKGKALRKAIVDLIGTTQNKNQIQVVVGADKYQHAMNKIEGLSGDNINKATHVDTDLLKMLSNAGALNLAVTTHHHDKSIAIFDRTKKDNNLVALAIGSANPTLRSMGLFESGGNVEVSAVIDGIGNKEVTNYLANMSGSKSELFRHYNALTSGAIGNLNTNMQEIKKVFTKAYKVEQPALLQSKERERIQNIKDLHFAINNFTQTGSQYNQKTGAIQASFRYEPQLRNTYNYGEDASVNTYDPIGLRIKVTAPGKHGHTLSFDVTYSEEGNIIIADLNKIINGSIFVNKSNVPITLFDKAINSPLITKRTLEGGEISNASKLNPSETLLAFTETIQRAFIYQQEFGLVDLSFRSAVQQSKSIVLGDIKRLFTDAFAEAVPDHFNLYRDKDGKSSTVNLKTILNSLATKSIDKTSIESSNKIIGKVSELIANRVYGDSIITRSADRRFNLIFNALSQAIPNTPDLNRSQLNTLDNLVAESFLDTLLSGAEEFNDIKKQLITVNESARAAYKSATLTQARTILDELTGSFLSVHEETYAFYQGQERTSIFGETQNFKAVYGADSQISAMYNAGILNPLPLGHTTKVATAGSLYRSLSSTARGETLMLPGFGGLNQLSVADSDLSTGAAVGQDFESMTKTTPGLMSLNLEDTKQTIKLLLGELGSNTNEDLESPLDFIFGENSRLIYTPFDKLEQLTQRLKNVVGYRPALEFSQDFALSVINALGGDESLKAYYNIHKDATTSKQINNWDTYLQSYDAKKEFNDTSILSGSLRNVLPSTQFQELQTTREAIALERFGNVSRADDISFSDLQEYYHKALLKQGNVQHGFIGGSKYRRFALNLGASMFGDFSYLNAGYTYQKDGQEQAQIYGKQHNLRIKFNPDKVSNVLSTIDKITSVFSSPVIATTQAITLKDSSGANIIYQAGLYKVINEGELVKVGTYTDKGLIHLHGEMNADGTISNENKINAIKYTNYGPKAEPILIKVPASAKKTEGGLTYIAATPHLADTSRTTNIIELSTYTLFRPGTSSRIGGGGLMKGPVLYKTSDLFQQIDNAIKDNARFTPTEISSDKIYGLGSMNTFKGVNYETGLYLLSQEDSRNKLRLSDNNNLDGITSNQLLEGLSLLFLGDKQIKSSLIKHFTDTNNYAAALALKSIKGKDVSTGRFTKDNLPAGTLQKDALSALALTSTGILMLGGEKAVKDLDVGVVKDLVLSALSGDSSALGKLQVGYGKLIDLVIEKAIKDTDGSTLIVNEQNSISRGAGVIAHMLNLSTQLFNTKTKKVSGLYDVPLRGDAVDDLYRGKVQSIEGYDRQTFIDYAHQLLLTSGFQPKNINTTNQDTNKANIEENLYMMSLVHRRLDRAQLMETVIDNQVSQSLVASGMRDTVKQEYQFYLGMTNTKLNEYRSLVGEEGKSIQEAYLVAVAALDGGDLNTITRQQTLGIKLAASQLDDYQSKGKDSPFQGAGGLLRYQDLSLRTLATLYSSDVNYKVPTDIYGSKVNILTGSVLNTVTAQDVFQIQDSQHLMAKLRNDDGLIITQGESDSYTAGLLEMEVILRSELQSISKSTNKNNLSKYKQTLQQSLESITKSQRIILPNLDYMADGDGGYYVQFKSISAEAPAQGILLGTDFLSRIAQSFGDFETEIMGTQVALVSALSDAQPILAKLLNLEGNDKFANVRLTEYEKNTLSRLQESLRNSTKTLMTIPVTDIARQYVGDHESTKGAVGIAVNSFMLNPDEVVLGDRYLRIVGTQNENGQINKNSKLGVFVNKLVHNLTKDAPTEQLEIYNKIQDAYKKDLLAVIKSFSVLEGLDNTDDPRYNWRQDRKDRLTNLLNSFKDNSQSNDLRGLLSEAYTIASNMLGNKRTSSLSSNNGSLSTIEKQLLLKAAIYTEILGAASDDNIKNNKAINTDILARVIEDSIQHKYLKSNSDFDTVIQGLESNPSDYLNNQSNFTLEKLGYMAAGFMVARTGQPGGSSALDSNTNQFVPLSKNLFDARHKALNPGSSFNIDLDRVDTGMIVPSNSRLLSGLGDYDGDSYRLTTKQVEIKSSTKKLEKDLNQEEKLKIKTGYDSNINKYNEIATQLGLATLSNENYDEVSKVLTINKKTLDTLKDSSTTRYKESAIPTAQQNRQIEDTTLGKLIQMLGNDPKRSYEVARDYSLAENAYTDLSNELLTPDEIDNDSFLKGARKVRERLFEDSINPLDEIGRTGLTYGDARAVFNNTPITKKKGDSELTQMVLKLDQADKASPSLLFNILQITNADIVDSELSKLNITEDLLKVTGEYSTINSLVLNTLQQNNNILALQELEDLGLIYKTDKDKYKIHRQNTKINVEYDSINLQRNQDRYNTLQDTTRTLVRAQLTYFEEARKNNTNEIASKVLRQLTEATVYLGSEEQNSYLFLNGDSTQTLDIKSSTTNLQEDLIKTLNNISNKQLKPIAKNILSAKSGTYTTDTLIGALSDLSSYLTSDKYKDKNLSSATSLMMGILNLSTQVLKDGQSDPLYLKAAAVINNQLLQTTSLLVDKTANLLGVDFSMSLDQNITQQFDSFYNMDKAKELQGYQRLIRKDLEELTDNEYTNLEVGLLSQEENAFRRKEARKMVEVERFIKSYTNVPEFVFNEIGGQSKLSTGEMFTFISQKYDLGNLADSADYNNQYIGNALLLKTIQKSAGVSGSVTFQDLNIASFTDVFKLENINSFLNQKLTDVLSPKDDLLKLAYTKFNLDTNSTINDLAIKVTAPEDISSHLSLITNRLFDEMKDNPTDTLTNSIENIMADNANLIQRTDIISKKVVGRLNTNLLSPIEFDASNIVIGEGGTNLIGRAYNTLIPLLDSLIIEQAFMYSTVSDSLAKALDTDDFRGLATKLGVVTGDPDSDTRRTAVEQRVVFRERFAGVTSLLSNFQQIVRDALKAKEGDNILDKFHQVYGYGEDLDSLIGVLQQVPDEDTSVKAIDKQNKNAVTEFLASQMGPTISNANFISGKAGTGSNYTYSAYSTQGKFQLLTTGFGALTLLGEYARIKDEGEFYNHFIQEGNTLLGINTREQFEQWVAEKQYDLNPSNQNHLAKEFVGLQIIDMMQRTQAAFSVTSLGEAKVNSITERLGNLVTLFDEANADGRLDNADSLKQLLFKDDDIRSIEKEIQTLLTGETDLDKDKQLMDTVDKQKKMDQMVVDFQEQYEVYKSYQESIKDISDKDDLKKAKANLVSELILRNIQNRDAKYNTLNTNTLEYLRKAAFDMSIFNGSNEISALPGDQQLQLASLFGYNHRLRALRSGKIADVGTALEASQFKLSSIITVLNKGGVDLTQVSDITDDQLNMILNYDTIDSSKIADTDTARTQLNIAGLVSGLAELTSLDKASSKKLLEFMVKGHTVEGKTEKVSGLSLLAQSSASLAVFEKLIDHQQKAIYDGNNTLAEALTSRLNDFFTNYNDNNSIYDADLIQGIDNYDLDNKLAESATERVQNIIAQETARVDNQMYNTQKATLNRMKSGSMIGILAAPLLFALGASGEVKLDERVGMFAFDAMQALAEVSAQPKSVTSQYTTSDMNAATMGFRNARIRQAMREEGIALGAVQGVAQEMLYKGIGGMVDLGVRNTIGRIAQKNPTLATVGGTAFSEILGGILSQAVSKAIIRRANPKNNEDDFLAETLKHLQNISEQVWQATEEALLSAIDNKQVEVGDAEHAAYLEFETGVISDNELNDLTGLNEILLADVSDDYINAEFEDKFSHLNVGDYSNS